MKESNNFFKHDLGPQKIAKLDQNWQKLKTKIIYYLYFVLGMKYCFYTQTTEDPCLIQLMGLGKSHISQILPWFRYQEPNQGPILVLVAKPKLSLSSPHKW